MEEVTRCWCTSASGWWPRRLGYIFEAFCPVCTIKQCFSVHFPPGLQVVGPSRNCLHTCCCSSSFTPPPLAASIKYVSADRTITLCIMQLYIILQHLKQYEQSIVHCLLLCAKMIPCHPPFWPFQASANAIALAGRCLSCDRELSVAVCTQCPAWDVSHH